MGGGGGYESLTVPQGVNVVKIVCSFEGADHYFIAPLVENRTSGAKLWFSPGTYYVSVTPGTTLRIRTDYNSDDSYWCSTEIKIYYSASINEMTPGSSLK